MCDYAFLINSFLLYTTIKKVVSSIDYVPATGQLKLVQYRGRFLQKETSEIDPNDVVKCKGQTFNKLIGYRSLLNAKDKYATESTGTWHDRLFMDSIINQEVHGNPLLHNKKKPKKMSAE